jgi:two-component system sensor histidine kinase KdpD
MPFSLMFTPAGATNRRIQYLAAVALVLAVSLLCHLASTMISEENMMLFYLVAVMLSALYWGEGPAMVVAVLSFVVLDTQFAHRLTWSSQYLISLATFLAVGFLLSYLSNKLRRQARDATQRERYAEALYSFSKKMHQNLDKDHLVGALRTHLTDAFGLDVEIYLASDRADLEGDLQPAPEIVLPPKERGTLDAVLSTGERKQFVRGATAPPVFYCPLSTSRATVGVAKLSPKRHSLLGDPNSKTSLTEEEKFAWKLVEAFCGQAALALDQLAYNEQVHKAEVLARTEKLQSALLNSISHDLQTPVASIKGSLQVMADVSLTLDVKTREGLVKNATEQAERLHKLVSNLLDMTRIEGGGLRLNLQPVEPEELVGALWEQMDPALRARVNVTCEPRLPDADIDFVLILSVLHNLVENANKYGGKDRPIEVHIGNGKPVGKKPWLEVSVSDHGPGVPRDQAEQIFERFSRLERDVNRPGSGLGLSIARGIVEAHGARIWVDARLDGPGSVFKMTLPTFVEPVTAP